MVVSVTLGFMLYAFIRHYVSACACVKEQKGLRKRHTEQCK